MKGGKTRPVCFNSSGVAWNTPESTDAKIATVGKTAVIQEKSRSECGEEL
jgi:hypothetical protein